MRMRKMTIFKNTTFHRWNSESFTRNFRKFGFTLSTRSSRRNGFVVSILPSIFPSIGWAHLRHFNVNYRKGNYWITMRLADVQEFTERRRDCSSWSCNFSDASAYLNIFIIDFHKTIVSEKFCILCKTWHEFCIFIQMYATGRIRLLFAILVI